MNNTEMLDSIRESLKARAAGYNAGGDIVVMEYVDAIVKRESLKTIQDYLGNIRKIVNCPEGASLTAHLTQLLNLDR